MSETNPIVITNECIFLSQNVHDQLRQKIRLDFSTDTQFMSYLIFKAPLQIEGNSFICQASFGAYTSIGRFCNCVNCTLGNYVTMKDYSQLGIGEHGWECISQSDAINAGSFFEGYAPLSPKKYPRNYKKYGNSIMPPVTVEHDVYIGERVLIPRKVTIGTGAILKAGSVISRDIPPYAIVEGYNSIVGQRFSDEICADLLASHWWDFDLGAVVTAHPDLPLHDPKEFLAFLQSHQDLPLLPKENNFVQPLSADQVKIYPVLSRNDLQAK